MLTASDATRDAEYVQIVLEPLQICKIYKPKFGHNKPLTLQEFATLYGSDPFYAWFGLDSPLLYAAHQAAGGMTSVYRQIGIGCQRLFQRIIMDTLGLTEAESSWSYQAIRSSGDEQTLSLDSRIITGAIRSARGSVFAQWLQEACQAVGVAPEIREALKGAVFEVRQGYKSRDSKRQNADLANAGAAYSAGYLPAVVLLSLQMDDTVAIRYSGARWLLLYGAIAGSPLNSTYAFCRDILGYDLADFFRLHSATFKSEVEAVLKALLT